MNSLFLLGILGLIQLTILPGLILIRWIKLYGSTLVQNIIYIFALSLITNYCLVFIFTVVKLFNAPVFFGVIIAELILIVILYRGDLKESLSEHIDGFLNRQEWHLSSLVETFRRRKLHDPAYILGVVFVTVVFVSVSVDSLLWVLKIFSNNLGDIFHLGDAVLNWNPWATLYWYRQIIPPAFHYGQLIPISWAVIYKLMANTQIQFFATSIMPLFFLFTLILLFDRGLESKQLHFFVALVFLRYMVKKFAFAIIDDGYVDLALMFFSFLPFFVLIKSREMVRNQQERYLLLGSIFAGGAAATKQGGLFVLLAYLILSYVLVIHGDGEAEREDRSQELKLLGKLILISCLIALPWYITSEVMMRISLRTSEFTAINEGVLGGKTYLERLWDGFVLIGKYNALYLISLLFLPFLDRAYRWLVLAVIIPYYFIWALFFSYDARNLTLTFPLVSLTAAAGITQVGYKSEGLIRWLKISKVKAYFIIAALLILVIAFSTIYPSFSNLALTNRQITLQKQLFFPQLNDAIYAAVAGSEPGTKILSNYRIEVLPGLEKTSILYSFHDLGDYLKTLREHPEIRLVLLSKDTSPEVVNYVLNEVKNGNYSLLTEAGAWIFVRIPSGGP